MHASCFEREHTPHEIDDTLYVDELREQDEIMIIIRGEEEEEEEKEEKNKTKTKSKTMGEKLKR